MSTKNLFDKAGSFKVLESTDLQTLGLEAESRKNIEAKLEEKSRFIPNVDFSSASNFAFYGSAEKYYTDAVERIYKTYPYDGSNLEKTQFLNSSSYLDLYVFNERYPRTTGYIKFSDDTWGSLANTLANDEQWGAPAAADYEYIVVKGGPHTASNGMVGKTIHSAFSSSNIYDTDIYETEGVLAGDRKGTRESNLKFDVSKGVTVEFWMNKEGWDVTNSYKESVFDLWNGKPSGSEQFGRLNIFLSGTANNGTTGHNADPFRIQIASGANSNANVWDLSFGYSSSVTTASIATSGWTHYAFSFLQQTDNTFEAKFYVNGVLKETATSSSVDQWGEITGSMKAYLGAIQTAPYTVTDTTASADFNGYGKLSASLDEFRYWKTKRTSKDIGTNWFTQVGGGTNEDIANAELGVYYKFNEGITGTSSVDASVLDYSGRISNGAWVSGSGYGGGAPNSRNTGSAIVSASAAFKEFRDPIIYKEHADVANLYAELQSSGSAHDYINNSSIYYTLPSWIIDEDSHQEKKGEILNLTQIIASYFDQLHLQVREIPDIKDTRYTSSSLKPYPFSNKLLENAGMMTPEIFVDSDIVSRIKSKDGERIYEEELSDIKNLIYQNIYNNLTYIYKSKGTEKSFRNLIRCYGVDDELIKINMYGDNVTYKLEDNRKDTAVRKNYVSFNHPNRFAGVVVQQSSSDTVATGESEYGHAVTNVSGSATNLGEHFDFTEEIEVIFPKKPPVNSKNYFITPFITSSIYGSHGVQSAKNPAAFKWLGIGNGSEWGLQLFAIRPEVGSKDAYFLLTSSLQAGSVTVHLTTSLFKDVYDDTKWNFAVRRLNPKQKSSQIGLTTGSNVFKTGDNYMEFEFYGVNTKLGAVQNEFLLTTSSTTSTAARYISVNRRYYVGARRENFTGAVAQFSDVEATSFRLWQHNIDNDTILAHAKDPLSYGTPNPYRNAAFFREKQDHLINSPDGISSSYIPEMDTLLLHWNFADVTGSDTDGQFQVRDFSSGSSEAYSTAHPGSYGLKGDRYPIVAANTKFNLQSYFGGRGYSFETDNTGSINERLVYASRQRLPEVLDSSDTVNILTFDDEQFDRTSRPINNFFAIEKSMYQTISEEMINLFSTIVGFNNLIGDPVNRYRQDYKEMGKLRQLFFEKQFNAPDIDKYVKYYKWLDSSLSEFLNQLVPISANSSGEVRTVIESHALERSKYHNKFPGLELKKGTIEAGIKGVNYFYPDPNTLNWRYAHAPTVSPAFATATITVADGDANCGMSEKESIVITSADGQELTYVIVDDNATTVATGTVLEAGTDTGASTAGSALARGIAVAINTTGTVSTQNDFLVQLKAAIEHANGHNGKITVSAVPDEDDGEQSITLTQAHIGDSANTTITDDISQTTIAGFTGGRRASEKDNAYWWKNRAERDNASLNTGVSNIVTSVKKNLLNISRQNQKRNNSVPLKITGRSDTHGYNTTNPGNYTRKNYIHNGVNFPEGKKPFAFKANLPFDHSPNQRLVFVTDKYTEDSTSLYNVNVNDEVNPNLKQKYKIKQVRKYSGGGGVRDENLLEASKILPFTPSALGSASNQSIQTGYHQLLNDEATSIDNLHVDGYDSGEHGMQGPFTERFVGGHQHRHVFLTQNLNPGRPDNDLTYNANVNSFGFPDRPEAWDLRLPTEGVSFFHPAHGGNPTRPKAMFMREEVAKRPVNIRNIKHRHDHTRHVSGTLVSSIGNFTKHYELVMSSDRSLNNRTLIKSEGFTTGALVSTFVSGVNDYEKVARDKSEHVIVERFSAPGGPETAGDALGGVGLDFESGQYSPYNDLNTRNMSVRKVLNRTFLKEHAESLGYKSGSTTVASFHNTNRNTRRQIVYKETDTHAGGNSRKDFQPANYTTGTVFSNGFVSMPIPQSDLQYAWITGALANKGSDYLHGSKSAEILGYAHPDGEYSASSGYSSAITFASASDFKTTRQAPQAVFVYNPKEATGIAFGEHSPVAAFVKLNLGIRDPVTASDNQLGYVLDHDVGYYLNHGDEGGKLWQGATVNAEAFVQRMRTSEALATVAIFNGLMLQRNGPYGYPMWKQIRTGEHPVARALVANHTVSVLQEDTITRHTRGSDTGSAYEVQAPARYGKILHYRESPVISKYKPVQQVIMHNSVPISVKSSYANVVSLYSNDELSRRYTPVSDKKLTYNIMKDKYNRDNFIKLVCSETVYPSEKNVYSNKIRERTDFANNFWRDDRLKRTTLGADKKTVFGMDGIEQSAWSLDPNEDFETGLVVATINYSASDKKSGELQNNYVQVHHTDKTHLTASALYARKHMLSATGSVVGYGNAGGVINIPETRSVAIPAGNFPLGVMQISGGNAAWDAGRTAGKVVDGVFVSASRNPWYDSYQDYAESLRLLNKDYSLVPEFRISEHIEKYVVSSSNNFLADNTSSFSMFGIPDSSDVPNNSSVDNFYTIFSFSDFMKYFEIMKTDHRRLAKPSSLTLKMKALKKFLPYNGFYPAERTLELASQFSKSYGKYINATSSQTVQDATLYPKAAWRPFMNWAYAPGIMYNSIKSGLAVDYPIFTGSYYVQTSGVAKGFDYHMIVSGSPRGPDPGSTGLGTASFDRRIPFEAIVNPERHVKNMTMVDMEPHTDCRLNVTASWTGDGDSLYSMMASNFFAEVPSFFLPDGKFTTLRSKPENEFKQFVPGQYYAARIKLRRSYNQPRTYVSGTGADNTTISPFPVPNLTLGEVLNNNIRETFTMYSRPSAFGPPGSGRKDGNFNRLRMDSLGGLNPGFTPPYYDGEAWYDIIFSASSDRHTLREIFTSASQVPFRFDEHTMTGPNGGPTTELCSIYSRQNINKNAMQVSASLNIFGRATEKNIEYDEFGNVTSVSDTETDNKGVWVIQPKFETPMLNFADNSVRPITASDGRFQTDINKGTLTIPQHGSESVPRGMWHQFGLMPDAPDKGIFLEIEEIPRNWIHNRLSYAPALVTNKYDSGRIKSLLDVVPFEKTSTRLGELSDSKVVKEAVVVVPFMETGAGKKFFNIPKNTIRNATPESSVGKLVTAMNEYVFPPYMDFINFPNAVKPVAMYVFEFSQTLSKDDLSYIWQNIPPDIGASFEQAESTITHPLMVGEMLKPSNMNNMKFMVFKVKQKAETNYYEQVISSKGKSDVYDFGVTLGRTQKEKYSYNWPYDFFSLVEFVKLDTEITLDTGNSATGRIESDSVPTVNNIDVSRLTIQQQSDLRAHSQHHSSEHILEMVNSMEAGMSFGDAHNEAVRKVGD